jgi:hypothetical protein
MIAPPRAGVRILLDVEQPLYELNVLLNSESFLNRCAKD